MNCRNNDSVAQKMGKGIKFERIRRITGYLVGTMKKWNNAKQAEEKDRVKHTGFEGVTVESDNVGYDTYGQAHGGE